MNIKYILLTILNSTLTISGQVLWKTALLKPNSYSFKLLANPLIISGILVYGLATVLWLYVLSKIPLSVAYAFTSITYAFSLIAGYIFFEEAISPYKIIGTALILTGLIFFAKA